MTSKTKRKSPKKHKRIFFGWINPEKDLPESSVEIREIAFGISKWNTKDKQCKITVEWKDQP